MWAKHKKQPGFTIVELLIVIVVIGILAAITIVAYNGVQNKANDTAIQSDLTNLAKKVEAFKVTSATDQYPTNLLVASLEATASKAAYGNHYTPAGSNGYNLLYCRDSTFTNFAIIARSKSGKTFAIRNGKALYESTTTLTTNGTQCPADGIPNPFSSSWTFVDGVWQI